LRSPRLSPFECRRDFACNSARPRRSERVEKRRWEALDLEFDFFERAFGRNDVVVEAQLRRLEAEGQSEQLRQMEDRNVDLFLEHARGVGLLSVEVEMTERTRGDEKIGSLFLGLDDVVAAHRQGLVAVERYHRESAALRGAAILDGLGAEQ